MITLEDLIYICMAVSLIIGLVIGTLVGHYLWI